MKWEPERHSFKRGDEVLWRPGFRSIKKYPNPEYDAVYLSGNTAMRARSIINLIYDGRNVTVMNTRLFKKVVLVEI
jgi:hypothetical protein